MSLPILLLDGGLGTTLGSPPHNITFTSSTPLWSSHLLLSAPSTLTAVHRSFLTVGTDILLTATYQTSFEGFTRTDPKFTRDDAARYMRSAIPLARNAFGTHPDKPVRLALSLGPYGATMSPVAAEYSGLYPEEMNSEDALRKWHGERLRVFAEDDASWGTVEYVAFETVRRPDEVKAIRGTVRDILPRAKERKPWWICGVFPAEEVDEDDVRRWVRAALGDSDSLPRPWGIGVNCTRVVNLGLIVDIMLDELRKLIEQGQLVDEWQTTSGRPWLVLYPDGTQGEEYDPATKEWVQKRTEENPQPWDEAYWDAVKKVKPGDWEGAILGGCCRAGPEHIAALRRRVDRNTRFDKESNV
ncbi:homocysteine S-methyltransferase family protein [Aspergillus chevalieri]|uniref:Hcy-binding domain-containing protein n=1 Tax=Aspergillus chevalieri TaxID=182096 RepID=A0A7R7VXJ6_ASPCH|nr:uncharacterized protein ACHE_70892S [Aspergillus chevalieri]BCR92049.1 hypothetical protein ACHE_70892S [Aspergillus chevalieri]